MPIDFSSALKAQVSTLDLLAEIEAELVRLRAQNKRLTAALKQASKKPASKKLAAKKPAAKKRAPKKQAAQNQASPPEPAAPVPPKAAPKRPALGRGLAQLFGSPGR